MNNFYIYGLHSVIETLENNPKNIEKIFLKEDFNHKDLEKIKNLASLYKVPFNFVNIKKIRELVGEVNHQGIVAIYHNFKYFDLDEFLIDFKEDKKYLFLILDEIQDVHNFGAILRSALAFNVDAVIIPKHNSVSINGTIFKTSAGAVNKIPIIRVSNLNNAIEKLKKKNIWVAALDMNGENIFRQNLQFSLAFVIGNEASGVHKKIKENSDFIFKIPISEKIESLNASVATSIVLAEWNRQNWEY